MSKVKENTNLPITIFTFSYCLIYKNSLTLSFYLHILFPVSSIRYGGGENTYTKYQACASDSLIVQNHACVSRNLGHREDQIEPTPVSSQSPANTLLALTTIYLLIHLKAQVTHQFLIARYCI